MTLKEKILSIGKIPLLLSVLALLVLVLVLVQNLYLSKNNNVEKTLTNKVANKVEYYSVKSVVDGDTILLTSGKEVRFLGIDTPETHHPSSGLECYGKEATDYSATLLEGKKVRLISDVTDKDGYGRLLRYVFTDNGVFVNYELVANGYAQVLDIPPDTLFAKTFTEAQQGAVKNKIGIWGSCIKNKEVQ